MTEIRCKKCNRLLMRVSDGIHEGTQVEVKCPKCGYLNEIEIPKFYGKVKFDKENFGVVRI